MKTATRMMLRTARGRKIFQPAFMRRSYLRRGMVQRTHTKTNSMTLILATKAMAERRNPKNVAGSSYHGMSQPPKKSVTIKAEIVAMAIYSDMKKRANFIDEYSV